MKPLGTAAKAYVAFTALAGLTVLGASLWEWRPECPLRDAFYLLGAVVASQFRVRLPGGAGTLSMSFLFVLIAVTETNLADTLLIASFGMGAQTLGSLKARPSAPQIVFNLSGATLSAACAWMVFHSPWIALLDDSLPALLFFATVAYFLANTVPLSLIIGLTQEKTPSQIWREGFLWTAPEHLVGAAVAALFHLANVYVGWQVALLTMPAAYLVYGSYCLYLRRLEEDRKHAGDIAEMHWRTIEALAMAIDAKDSATRNHLQRVRVYATEIAREMKLGEPQQKAVEIASLLHDIGKLAVPDHILSKPARLSPEEFQIMKTHPTVGADILERVGFPCPVVPIVRAHHEKWDGTGYPFGLRGEAIPIGARIVAAVDCLDALASTRQYRRALPLDEAMEKVSSEAGRSFDPRVVDILQRRYLELENLTRTSAAPAHTWRDPICVSGVAPGSGYEIAGEDSSSGLETHPLTETARGEFQKLLELARGGSAAVTHAEIFSLTDAILDRMVPHDSMAVYLCRNHTLIPQFVAGKESTSLSSLRIPLGRGISGWVLEKRKPVVNGDPIVESHYLVEPWHSCSLRSVLSIPLEGPAGISGALALYARATDHFQREHLRLLLSVSTLIAQIAHQATGLVQRVQAPASASSHFSADQGFQPGLAGQFIQ